MSVVNVKVSNIRPQFKNLKSWSSSPDNIYIGRKGVVFIEGKRYPEQNSQWANPYKIGKDGTRDQVLEKYRNLLKMKQKADPLFYDKIKMMKGKKLGCWCKPDKCHGDILLELINSIDDE